MSAPDAGDIPDLTDKRNVLVVNDNAGRPSAIRKRCYELFLQSRTQRLATQFGRTDWAGANRQIGIDNRTELVVTRQRGTTQKNWLLTRAKRFSTVHASRYD